MVAHGDRAAPNGQELLAEFVQYGRQAPFEEIVRRYAGMVFNVCLRITRDKHEAEDTTQAVFLTLALQAKRGTEIKALGPWLQQVAKRLSLDLRRGKKRRKSREERHHEEQTHRRESILDDTLPSADMDELKTILNEELQKLPAKYRLPLILHYFGGLNREEMAAELGCKPSTLGVRIFRGREMLAGRLSSRGITISSGAMAVALGYLVKHTISGSMISSTSYAASAMMSGHSGVGLASAQVIGLTRKAGSAMMLGKVQMAAIGLVIAASSLGAGAKAMGIPMGIVTQLISNQVQRIIAPLLQPFTQSIRADAAPAPTATPAAVPAAIANGSLHFYSSVPMAVAVPPSQVITPKLLVASAGAGTPPAGSTVITPADQMPGTPRPVRSETAAASPETAPTTDGDDHNGSNSNKSSSLIEASLGAGTGVGGTSASGGSGTLLGGGGGGSRHVDDNSGRAAVLLPVPAAVATSSQDLFVPASITKTIIGAKSSAKSGTSSGSTPTAETATQIVQIAAGNNGLVTESNGIVRGYGSLARKGTITMDGIVVADGYGADRTLDFSSFSCIKQDITNASAGGTNGWYAVDHGRLTLPLMRASGTATYTWGDATADPSLDLVNSVRLTMPASASAPETLSLLSPDRTDIPEVTAISGAPIGLWQVDPDSGDLGSADLSIRYDDGLISALGASESNVTLWTLGSTTSTWQPVPVSDVTLDTADHTISADVSDFSYFALSVPSASGQDVEYLVSHPLSQFAPATGVPEPASIGLLLGAGLLLRRRSR